MLDDIENEHEIKRPVFGVPNIPQPKLEPFGGFGFAHFKRLRRIFVSPERAITIHPVVQLHEDLSGSTSHLANGSRPQMMIFNHAQDLVGLPRRFLGVPERVLFEVDPVLVNVLVSLGAR